MQMMLPTYEIAPTVYQRKLKDSDGNFTGEEESVIQFKQYMPIDYTLNVSASIKDRDEVTQKLLLAAKNGDTVKVQGTSEVKNFKNGSMHLFEAVSVDYNPKPMMNKA